jgi:hypothetical protein
MSSTAWQAAAGAQTACDIGVAGCTFRYPVARIDLGRRQMTGVRMAWRVIGPGPADAFVNAPVFAALDSVAWLDPAGRADDGVVPSAGGCLTAAEWR